MRRRVLVALILVLVPLALFAQQASPTEVAHGSEKTAHEVAHPNQEHGGEHEAPKFLGLPAWIFKLINMFLFLGFLGWLLGGPIKKAFGDRGEAIRRDAEEARARREKADQVASDIQARLSQLEEELKNIRERALQEGERQKRDLIVAAEAEAAKILASARVEVDNRLKRARAELTEFAGELAGKRAEEILRERITPEDQRKLFHESVKEVGEVRS